MKRGGANDIFSASKSGNLARVKELVESGADMNVQNINKETALMFATDHLDIVKYLVEKGADMNAQNMYKVTALMYATLKNRFDIVKYLVEKGADMNVQNRDGETALMYATDKNHIDIVKYLVEKGADMNVKNRDGVTALMFATFKNHIYIVKCLVEKGADMNVKNNRGKTACDQARSAELKAILCHPYIPPVPPVPTGECNVPSGESDPMTAEDIKNGDVMAEFANESRYGRYWTLEGYNLMIDWNRGRHNPPRNPVTKVQFDPTQTTYCTAKIVAGGKRRKTIRRKRTKKMKKTRKQ